MMESLSRPQGPCTAHAGLFSRNFAISLLRLLGVVGIKAALRGVAAQAHKVLGLLRL